jgi:small neutral amino acid transporter SnatA (MarC family)
MAVIGGLIVLGGIIGVIAVFGEDGQASAVGAGVMTMVIVGLILVMTLAFAQVRVSVDRRGLRVVSRLLGIRLKRVSLHYGKVGPVSQLSPGPEGHGGS